MRGFQRRPCEPKSALSPKREEAADGPGRPVHRAGSPSRAAGATASAAPAGRRAPRACSRPETGPGESTPRPGTGAGRSRRGDRPSPPRGRPRAESGASTPSPRPNTPAITRWRVPSDAVKNWSCPGFARHRRAISRGSPWATEEVRDLEGRRLGRIGAVHGIGLDRRREVLPDRPRRRLGGIGGAHEIAQPERSRRRPPAPWAPPAPAS